MAGEWAGKITKMTGKVAFQSKAVLPAEMADDASALRVTRALIEDGYVLRADGGLLKMSHPEKKPLDVDRRALVARQKELILALLAPRPTYDLPIDWQTEWRLERDMLLRRAAAAEGEVRSKLLALAGRQPADEGAWLAVGKRIRDLESELVARGKLPAVEYLEVAKS